MGTGSRSRLRPSKRANSKGTARWRCVLFLGAALTGCGGGADVASNSSAPQARVQSPSNLVLTSGGEGSRAVGRFSVQEGQQLARSQRPFVSSGSPSDRYSFSAVGLQGYYRVYAWWGHSEHAGAGVKASVTHAHGQSEHSVDQRRAPGQWHLLGVYAFKAEAPAQVDLSAQAPTRFIADAVRFEYVGDSQPLLAIRTTELIVGEQHSDYAQSLEAESGGTPYQWSIAAGELPPGLVLDRHGRIVGKPSAIGRFPLTLRVIDARGEAAEQTLALYIVQPEQFEPPPAARPADGSPRGTPPSLASLLSLVAAAPQGSWIRVNLNLFSDAFTPLDLRPLFDAAPYDASAVIRAWSSFAWDPNRGDLWIYGGGHANSSGNEVMRWRGSTRLWERASLPSQIKQDDLGHTMAIDGYNAAPPSAHTYDNGLFLPISDRFITFGGAAFTSGLGYVRQTAPGATTQRAYGPFMFNPNLANGNKVGGTTGSHVKRVAPRPDILGGNMWQNRDTYMSSAGTPPLPGLIAHRDGCTAYAQENGKDVIYVTANPGLGTGSLLYKYTINDVNNPAADIWEWVGRPPQATGAGLFGQQSCAYDQARKLYVRRAGFSGPPFAYWQLTSAGSSNFEVQFTPADPSGEFNYATTPLHMCGMDFDPVRSKFVLWCGDARVWNMTAPATLGASGWTLQKQPAPAGAVPTGDFGTGILGKWKYVPNLDVFIGLQGATQGNVWVYKPIAWQAPPPVPGNQAPSVALTQPVAGAGFAAPAGISLAATASDADGSVSKVEFFQGASKLGEDLAAPYTFAWSSVPAGSYALTAAATDNAGARTTSSTVNVTVSSATATVLSFAPSSLAAGATLTVSWSGIAAPSGTDWIGLHRAGQPSTSFIDWIYVGCSKAVGAARANGNCPFAIPSTLAAGTYELRLHRANTFTVIATRTGLTVTSVVVGPTLTVAPASAAPGASLTVTWSAIAAPNPTDWVGLHRPGQPSTSFIDWLYVGCSKVAGAARASGSCVFRLPSALSSGGYEMRLHAANGFNVIATSNGLNIP